MPIFHIKNRYIEKVERKKRVLQQIEELELDNTATVHIEPRQRIDCRDENRDMTYFAEFLESFKF